MQVRASQPRVIDDSSAKIVRDIRAGNLPTIPVAVTEAEWAIQMGRKLLSEAPKEKLLEALHSVAVLERVDESRTDYEYTKVKDEPPLSIRFYRESKSLYLAIRPLTRGEAELRLRMGDPFSDLHLLFQALTEKLEKDGIPIPGHKLPAGVRFDAYTTHELSEAQIKKAEQAVLEFLHTVSDDYLANFYLRSAGNRSLMPVKGGFEVGLTDNACCTLCINHQFSSAHSPQFTAIRIRPRYPQGEEVWFRLDAEEPRGGYDWRGILDKRTKEAIATYSKRQEEVVDALNEKKLHERFRASKVMAHSDSSDNSAVWRWLSIKEDGFSISIARRSFQFHGTSHEEYQGQVTFPVLQAPTGSDQKQLRPSLVTSSKTLNAEAAAWLYKDFEARLEDSKRADELSQWQRGVKQHLYDCITNAKVSAIVQDTGLDHTGSYIIKTPYGTASFHKQRNAEGKFSYRGTIDRDTPRSSFTIEESLARRIIEESIIPKVSAAIIIRVPANDPLRDQVHDSTKKNSRGFMRRMLSRLKFA